MLGIWSGNACLGNIVGTGLVALMFAIFDKTLAWKVAMVAAAGLVALHGLVIHFFLVADPKDVLYQHTSLDEAKPESVEMKPSPTATSATESASESASESVAESAPESVLESVTESETIETVSTKRISFFAAWCIPGVRDGRVFFFESATRKYSRAQLLSGSTRFSHTPWRMPASSLSTTLSSFGFHSI